ncbi:MFS transporter [Streptomyces triculaminicus]|uniref:MFS transporter n=1 Tax=Streptomyces triculaminicus TaxID=2816232 RepID=A0A939FLS6_9ACTN|nr:MFS transporter [Streptomyces triculaminicus]MBO0652863.1 MFS transporter [Streptomyces triculaminicus]
MTTSTDRKWWAFAGVGLISFLGCIDLTIVNTAAPQIQSDLGASVTDLQLIVNMFIVALSMFMVTMGRLADAYGRRRVLYAGTVVFGLASLGAGFADSTGWLIAFRFLQGAAGAILYTSTGAIVQNAFPESQRGRAIGALYGVNGVGLAIGPLLGGVIVSALGWHWVFWVNVPLVALALALCSFSVRESRNEDAGPGVDWPGLVLISLGIPAVVLAFTLGGSWGWSSGRTLGLLAFALVVLIAFYAVERRAADPIISFRLFRHRSFLTAIVSDFALACFYTTVLFLMPLYLHEVHGYGGYATGALLLPCTAVMAVLSPFVGRLTDRFGPRRLLLVGFAAFTVSALLLTRLEGDTSLAYVAVALVAMGLGWACILGPATVSALSSVPERQAGLAMGSSWTFHNLGGAIGLAVGIVLYRAQAEDGLTSALARLHAPAGDWTHDVVADPERAADLLREHTSLTSGQVGEVFDRMFSDGTQAAMWMVAGTSLAALVVVGLLGLAGRRAAATTGATPEAAVTKETV